MYRRTAVAISFFFALNSYAFEGFDKESQKVSQNIGCLSPRVIGADRPLYTCVGGASETVKFFINGDASRTVVNVKFIWNDWTKNTGYGTHADKSLARAWAASLGTLYAPHQVEEVLGAFNGKRNVTIENENYTIVYTYSKGPAMDERMMVVRKK